MITIVMALYKPNLDWLKEELDSIQNQSYQSFQVFAWNDCPEDTYDYNDFFKRYLGNIEFNIFRGEENLGSNGAFEKLTEKVNTPYIAYSDQDDIWCTDKLEVLVETIEKEQANLVYSDMAVIDENSKLVSENIAAVRPRHIFYTDNEIVAHLLAKNFVTGCTMMMKTDIAKAALPFPKSVFHDWWLAICAAIHGNIVKAPKTLMKYRIYGGNQSAVLNGIFDKKSYYEVRIKKHKEFVEHIYHSFGNIKEVTEAKEWNNAREEYFFHPNIGAFRKLFSAWKYNRSTVLMEIMMPFMPEFIFQKIVDSVKKGKI